MENEHHSFVVDCVGKFVVVLNVASLWLFVAIPTVVEVFGSVLFATIPQNATASLLLSKVSLYIVILFRLQIFSFVFKMPAKTLRQLPPLSPMIMQTLNIGM